MTRTVIPAESTMAGFRRRQRIHEALGHMVVCRGPGCTRRFAPEASGVLRIGDHLFCGSTCRELFVQAERLRAAVVR